MKSKCLVKEINCQNASLNVGIGLNSCHTHDSTDRRLEGKLYEKSNDRAFFLKTLRIIQSSILQFQQRDGLHEDPGTR